MKKESVMKILLAAILLFAATARAQLTGASASGGIIGAPTGGSSNITASFDCRSFGQTASAGGSLNISYKTPLNCWASASTVSGVSVNGTTGTFGESFVPEVWFDWNWDDSSQGTASRTATAWDLGKAVGVVASHVYAPSTFVETCNGGTNSAHTLTLTVYSLVSGVRESDSATLSVCVENPATTWPAPVAYCDDADCSNDSFASLVNPGTPIHGGNGTDLATILQYCEANGSHRVLVEGGVTFATASAFNINNNSCLVESYGGSKATFDFNVSTARIDLTGCAKMRISGVTFTANDADVSLFLAGNAEGCVLLDDWNVATGAGERLSAVIHSGGGGSSPNLTEFVFNNFDFTAHCVAVGCNLNAFYIQTEHSSWINGQITATGEHNIRWPNYRWVVVDAMYLADAQPTKHLLAMRQNCGSLALCTDETSSHTAAITRSELRPSDDSAVAVQLNNDGSGATDEWTQTFDLDFIENVFAKISDANATPRVYIDPENGPDSDLGRIRLVLNAADLTWMDSSTESDIHNTRGGTDYYVAGNAVSCVGNCANTRSIVRDSMTGSTVVKNNVCYESGAGACDLFPSYAESADNLACTTDPWDRDGAAPGTDATFTFADVGITSSAPANCGGVSLKGGGVITAYPTDFEGESIPQSSDYDSGVDDE
jgi:hypothetical protein